MKSTKTTRHSPAPRRRTRKLLMTAAPVKRTLRCTCRTPLVRIAGALGIHTVSKPNPLCPLHGHGTSKRRPR